MRRAIALLASGGVILAAWATGDGGAARAAIGDATGPLVATDVGGAVLTARDLIPGDARTGEVTVTNVGDAGGAFALTEQAPDGDPLSAVLDLVVEDLGRGVVFSGKLGELGTVALGDLAQGEARRYRFIVRFPHGAGDDVLQGAATSATFVWGAEGALSAAPGPPDAPPAPATAAAPLPATTTPLGARLSARARQQRRVVAAIACDARCTATLSATATVGHRTVRLGAVRRTLGGPGVATVRLSLRGIRGRPVVVRLTLRAVVGGRTVTARRTVRVG